MEDEIATEDKNRTCFFRDDNEGPSYSSHRTTSTSDTHLKTHRPTVRTSYRTPCISCAASIISFPPTVALDVNGTTFAGGWPATVVVVEWWFSIFTTTFYGCWALGLLLTSRGRFFICLTVCIIQDHADNVPCCMSCIAALHISCNTH